MIAAGSQTAPPGPRTGFAHRKCYAAPLEDCSEKISREHYISKNLLDAMGGTVEASGLSFLADPTSLPAQALAAKILCERHNNALSVLDSAGGDFFATLRDFDEELRDALSAPTTDERVVNGADFERWCLKMLVGMARGGAIESSSLRPELDWLGILFQGREWPEGWGLSLGIGPEERYAFDGLDITTSVNPEDNSLWAATVNLAGFPIRIHFGVQEGEFAYRPAGIRFLRPSSPVTKTIALTWPGPAGTGVVEMTRIGQYDGPRPFGR